MYLYFVVAFWISFTVTVKDNVPFSNLKLFCNLCTVNKIVVTVLIFRESLPFVLYFNVRSDVRKILFLRTAVRRLHLYIISTLDKYSYYYPLIFEMWQFLKCLLGFQNLGETFQRGYLWGCLGYRCETRSFSSDDVLHDRNHGFIWAISSTLPTCIASAQYGCIDCTHPKS